MKYIKYIILLVYLLFSYTSLYAEISVIPDREYFATVQELLDGAKSSHPDFFFKKWRAAPASLY